MLKSGIVSAAVAASLLTLPAPSAAAIGGLWASGARTQSPLAGIGYRDGGPPYHRGGHGGGPAYGPAVHPHALHHRPWHYRYHRTGRYYAAPPVYYRYADDCAWLEFKYRRTGHPYWWQRYCECRGW